MARNERWEICLGPLDWEIFTVMPVQAGVAPLGLVDMLNTGAAIDGFDWQSDGQALILAHGAGRLAIYSDRSPAEVRLDGAAAAWSYDAAASLVLVELVVCSSHRIELSLVQSDGKSCTISNVLRPTG
jgi:hypothetical protein